MVLTAPRSNFGSIDKDIPLLCRRQLPNYSMSILKFLFDITNINLTSYNHNFFSIKYTSVIGFILSVMYRPTVRSSSCCGFNQVGHDSGVISFRSLMAEAILILLQLFTICSTVNIETACLTFLLLHRFRYGSVW